MRDIILPHSLEWSAVLCSILAVVLTAQRKLLSYPVALLACLLYGWIFMQARLYADALLQGGFCLGLLYGWITWQRDKKYSLTQNETPGRKTHSNPLFIRRLPKKHLFAGLVATILFGIFWGSLLQLYSDDVAPFLDAGLSGASLLGQYWTARRYRESWILWAGTDLCYMLLFIQRALYPTALLYGVFIVLALYGYRSWREIKTGKESEKKFSTDD